MDVPGGWFRRPKTVENADFVMLNGGRDVAVVGESRYQPALSRAAGSRMGDGVRVPVVATLVPDVGNRKDPHAIAIEVNRLTVGYLPSPIARAYGPVVRQLRDQRRFGQCHATIVGGWDRGGGDRAELSIFLDLAAAEHALPAETEVDPGGGVDPQTARLRLVVGGATADRGRPGHSIPPQTVGPGMSWQLYRPPLDEPAHPPIAERPSEPTS